MLHCQTFKQKIEELKEKAQNIEALLLEYRNTGKEEIAQQFERELDAILKEIEEFKEKFKNEATRLIEEFIQRRENQNDPIEIIFDETDFRFIIEGSLEFDSRTHLNDFPDLIKEIRGYLSASQVQILDLPNLRKAGSIFADNAQTINLPNLEEAINIYANNVQTINLPNIRKLDNIYFYKHNPNLESLLNQAKEWKTRGILRSNIYIVDEENKVVQQL
jgi:hypothetical protein